MVVAEAALAISGQILSNHLKKHNDPRWKGTTAGATVMTQQRKKVGKESMPESKSFMVCATTMVAVPSSVFGGYNSTPTSPAVAKDFVITGKGNVGDARWWFSNTCRQGSRRNRAVGLGDATGG
ncbi:unnamed protein product [Lactuca saligna]|uniref:Uncharacterized protein n=1 Tax=Lactuca saligna TaxID=75948 RepID=A0AA36DY17_LACSI|nr:unnamed protein product [Lactuca saligna]